MAHCNSALCEHGASCLDMSKTFLPYCLTGNDTFTNPAFVILPNAHEFKKFGAWELIPDTLGETSLGSVVNSFVLSE